MDWFERLTGFREGGYAETRDKLSLVDGRIRNLATDRNYAVGTLKLPSLEKLRSEARDVQRRGRSTLSIVQGDVRAMPLEVREPQRAVPGRLAVQHAGNDRSRRRA